VGDAAKRAEPTAFAQDPAHPLLFFPAIGEEEVDDDLERYLNSDDLRFIRFKANQLAGKYGFRSDEIEDIQQSLVLDSLKRFEHFDSRRGSRLTFNRSVVNHAVATLIEARKAAHRGFGVCHVSLTSTSDDNSPNSPAFADFIFRGRPSQSNGRVLAAVRTTPAPAARPS
jgi:hypothetical protein